MVCASLIAGTDWILPEAPQAPSEPAPVASEEFVPDAIETAPEPSEAVSAALNVDECQGSDLIHDPVFRLVDGSREVLKPQPEPIIRPDDLASLIGAFLSSLKPGMEVIIRVPA